MRPFSLGLPRNTGRSGFLTVAAIAFLGIMANPALAQDDTTDVVVTGEEAKEENENEAVELDTTEEILVVGIRGSIQASTEKKRLNSSIVEAITAEDIGKLPDTSIAESIARLPGLAAQRLDGRANVISIRGFSPDFSTTTLNGREQVSASNNRAVEFDQFPSELIHGVTVYKTPDASLTSQAVGGTVDLQTVSPLRHGRQTLTANLRGEYNDLGPLNAGSTAAGYRGSISYIDQFQDDTIGVAIGYARMSSPTQEERWNTWGYREDTPGLEGSFVLGGAKPYVKSNELVRDGLMAVVEFKPDDENITTTLDAYYSRFDDTQLLRGIEIPLAWSGATLQDGYTLEDNIVTAGQFNDVEAVVRNDVVQRDADTLAFGWNTKYTANENWLLELDVNFSNVGRTESNMETYSGTGRGSGVGAVDNLAFELADDGTGATFSPGLNYADPGLIQLAGPLSWGWGLYVNGEYPATDAQDGFINRPTTEDSLTAIKMKAKQRVNIPWLDSFEYGLRVSRREKSLDDEGLFLTLKQYPEEIPVPGQFMLEPTSLDFIGMGDMLSYDAQALYNSGAYNEVPESNSVVGRSVNSWIVRENVFNTYVMTNIQKQLGGVSLLGNAGVQAVFTGQSSTGFLANLEETTRPNGDPLQTVVRTRTRDGDDFLDILPSMNLIFGLTESQKLRVSGGRALVRPRMDQMNASSSVNYNSDLRDSTDITMSPWSGGGGNPRLRPWSAWYADLSYEAYFGQGGYAAIAGYYKHISNFPFNQSVVRDFSDFLPLVDPTMPPALTEGLVTAPENAGSGRVYGVEVSTALPFGLFHRALTGAGILFSASLADSEVTDGTEGAEPITLPGFSSTVFGGTLYYDRGGFQVRGSLRYRSSFLGEISGLSLVRDRYFVEAETIVDAQIAYDLSRVGVKGTSVLLQGQNLTNQPFTSFHGADRRLVRDFQNYGRTILLGVTWKAL